MSEELVITPGDLGMNAQRLEAIPDYFERKYIKTGKLPCMATLVSRNGQIVHESYRGNSAYEGGGPIGPDTIFRIYSMTKAITSVAAMMLYEEGHFRLDMPVSDFIPEFSDVEVWAGGDHKNYQTQKPERPLQIHDLFTHTSGLSYGFLFQSELDALYREHEIGTRAETLEAFCRRIAKLPLGFSPGTAWNYGHSTDVLGRIVEIVSSQTLDVFFRERITGPLGMVDTDFYVPEDKLNRLGACYMTGPDTNGPVLSDGAGAETAAYKTIPTWINPGGGLVSTLRDYHRFCLMVLRGGALDGARLLSPKTLEFMRMNHLSGGRTIKDLGDKTFAETRMNGNGHSLLGGVTIDVAASLSPGSVGNLAWGGFASTFFWIDPEEELICVQATQMIPSSLYPIRPELQQLVYACLDW